MDDIILEKSLSKLGSGTMTDLIKALAYVKTTSEETSYEDVERWAMRECICPVVCWIIIADGFDPTLEGYETFERITYSYLTEADAIECLERYLGCSIHSATVADKIRAVTRKEPKPNPYEDRGEGWEYDKELPTPTQSVLTGEQVGGRDS